MPALFCYGSNGVEQLQRRLNLENKPSATSAYLDNHERVFAGYSRRWKGGVATVVPCRNKRVYGIIVVLTEEQLKRLDSFETGYTRKIKLVQCGEHRKRCHLYIKDSSVFTHEPSQKYLDAIKSVYLSNGPASSPASVVSRKV